MKKSLRCWQRNPSNFADLFQPISQSFLILCVWRFDYQFCRYNGRRTRNFCGRTIGPWHPSINLIKLFNGPVNNGLDHVVKPADSISQNVHFSYKIWNIVVYKWLLVWCTLMRLLLLWMLKWLLLFCMFMWFLLLLMYFKFKYLNKSILRSPGRSYVW